MYELDAESLNDYYIGRLNALGVDYYGNSAYEYWLGRNDAVGVVCGGSHIARGKKCHIGSGKGLQQASTGSRYNKYWTKEDEKRSVEGWLWEKNFWRGEINPKKLSPEHKKELKAYIDEDRDYMISKRKSDEEYRTKHKRQGPMTRGEKIRWHASNAAQAAALVGAGVLAHKAIKSLKNKKQESPPTNKSTPPRKTQKEKEASEAVAKIVNAANDRNARLKKLLEKE